MGKRLPHKKHEKGFSLLELTLVFLATGFLLVLGARFLTLYTVQARQDTMNERMENVKDALYEYYLLMGHYPCPSRLSAAPGDADYGRQQCRPAIVANDCVAGLPVGIFCSTVLSRDADGDTFNDTVLIGALPFLDILDVINATPFTFNDTTDPMNMRITYAVTENMADPTHDIGNPVNTYLGAIRIQDENSTEVLDPPASAHYVVASHGDNMEGAYMEDGRRFASCVNAAILPPFPPPITDPGNETALPPGSNIGNMAVEKENCDLNDALFTVAPRSLVDNMDYYDDAIAYAAAGLNSHWARSLVSAEAKIYNTNLGSVGVGMDTPGAKLAVAHNFSAQSTVAAVQYCSPTSQDCLDPNTIAGTGMKCENDGEVAYGTELDIPAPPALPVQVLRCRPLFTNLPVFTCPAGQYLVAFSNLGNMVCDTYP